MKYIFLLMVVLLMACGQDPEYELNTPPKIISLDSNKDSVGVFGRVEMTCNAVDEDGDSLQYEWDIIADSIIVDKNVAIWYANRNPGYYPIKCRVFDGRQGRASQTKYVKVYGYDTLNLPLFPLDQQYHEQILAGIRSAFAFRTTEEWEGFWNAWEISGGNPPSPAPVINFDSLTVVAIIYGYGSGCHNYRELITRAYVVRDTIVVKAKKIEPIAQPCLAQISPLHLVGIENQNSPIRFEGNIPN